MDAFAYPFRFSGGRVVKVDDQSDAYAAQIIAGVLKTGKGELLLNPVYGTEAIEFSSMDVAGLIHTVSAYHPTIRIDSINQEIQSDGTVKISVEFTRL
jgi:phage baseplate assembly protein W